MKNKFLKILVVCIAVLLLVSCSNDTTDTNSEVVSGTDVTESESGIVDLDLIQIVANGETEYAVVRSKDGTDLEKSLAIDLRETIAAATDADIKLRSDNKEEEACEIIVGFANRSVTEDLMLAETEYLVTVKDGKIIIAGGSDRALQTAYTYFTQNFIDATNKTVAVPKDLLYTGAFKTREEQLAEVRLIKYPEYPEENLPRNYDYTVKVKQGSKTIEIPVYNPIFADDYFNSTLGGDWYRRFCEFAFSGEKVTIEVTVNVDFKSYAVLPSSQQIPATCNGNVISFTIDEPQNVVIRLNGDTNTTLAIFAEEPLLEEDYPNKDALNVIYFEAGYHEVEGGFLSVPGGSIVFLEPGALVKARVSVASDAKVIGRGAFIESSPSRIPIKETGGQYLFNLKGSGIVVDGIKLLDAHTYNITCGTISDVEIKNVKILSNQISTDGFSIWGNGKNVSIHDCYWHISDNVFVIGGSTSSGFENFVVEDCIVATSYALFFPQQDVCGNGDIIFRNLDVLRCGSFLKATYNPGRGENAHGNFIMENINATDVANNFRFIWIENFISGEKTYTMKNIALPKKTLTVEIAGDTKGFNLVVDNVWYGSERMTENSNYIKSAKGKINVEVTSANDSKSANAGLNATKKASYTAQKIKVGELLVDTKVPFYTENGTTYVSAYEIVKTLDFVDVKLDETTGTLTFKDSKKEYTYKAEGNNTLKNGRLMVPLSFFKEIGSSASYDSGSKTVTIDAIDRGENLVANSDMELGLNTDWVTRNFSSLTNSSDAHSGKNAILVKKANDSSENGIYTDVADIVKKYGAGTYKVTAYVKKAGGTGTKISIGVTGEYAVYSAAAKQTYDLTDSWQKIEYTYVVSNVNNIKLVSLFVGGVKGNNIAFLVDDITMVKVS